MAEWFSPNEAAKYLRITRTTVYTLMREGRLPYHVMPKGRRRLRREDLDAVLKPAPTGDAEPQP